mgnify:CR=1 FL=1
MSRIRVFRLAALSLAVVMALGGVAGGAPTFTASKLAGGGAVRAFDPEVHGSQAVWTVDTPLVVSSDDYLRVWDFKTSNGTDIGTTTDGVDQEHADISAGRIVYEYDDGGDVDIRMWDSRLNVHVAIAATAVDEVGPRIDGNLVVWYVPSADELRYRDLGRGITSAVVPGAVHIEHWDVDNGAIIWSYEESAASDRIRRFRPGIDTSARYIFNGLDDLDILALQMHGTRIAFEMERVDGGDSDAWYADISSDYGIIRGRVEGDQNLFSERRPVVFDHGGAWETNKMGSYDVLFRTLPTDGTLSAAAGGAGDTNTHVDAAIFGRRLVLEKNNGVNDTEVWQSRSAPEVARTAGTDRYLTAVEASKRYFGRANNAVLCTGLNFPDALSAAPLARLLSGPLLLTRPTTLDMATINELDRLAVQHVYIIGGPDVVSQQVVDQLVSHLGVTCHRIYGSDRYQTSAAIAEAMAARLTGPHTVRRAFFARGDNFPDALALGPVAAGAMAPILLVRTNDVPATIAGAIDDLDITSGVIAGGPDVVSAGVRDSLRALMVANGGDSHDPLIVERWSGIDRYATAVAVVQGGLDARWVDLDTLGFATGLNFPDALGGGAALGCYGSPLVLTPPASLPSSVTGFLTAREFQIGRADIFGGPDVVGEGVRTAVAARLR